MSASWKTRNSISSSGGAKRTAGSGAVDANLELGGRAVFLGDRLDRRDHAEIVEHRRMQQVRHLPHALHHVDDLRAHVLHGAA